MDHRSLGASAHCHFCRFPTVHWSQGVGRVPTPGECKAAVTVNVARPRFTPALVLGFLPTRTQWVSGQGLPGVVVEEGGFVRLLTVDKKGCPSPCPGVAIGRATPFFFTASGGTIKELDPPRSTRRSLLPS